MRTEAAPPLFLFSVDLEDVRSMVDGGERYRPRVEPMTHRYLDFLRRHHARCTFFVVGTTALEHRSLIGEIIAEGHEIACHTHFHRPLPELTASEFRDDLRRNLAALSDCGAEAVTGFRAPIFSLVERTAWAYEVLAEVGIEYSSSVLPARSPLYGWEGFGHSPRRRGSIVELPMTVARTPLATVPFAGGVYLRVLPWPLVRRALRRQAQTGGVVLSYVHPYDIDTEQERFMHPGIKDSRFFNWLMYRNRGGVLPRMERVLEMGFEIQTYAQFVRERLAAGGPIG